MKERPSSPNCTHLDMDRVYGYDQRCCVCGSFSSIGFLYQCKQDNQAKQVGSVVSQKTGKTGPAESSLRNELEKCGLSESIIRGAETGHYTKQQLQKLKQLKRELQDTITDVEQAEQANGAIARLMEMSITPCSPKEGVDSLPNADTGKSGCTFTACHACRPHYLDRLYISFQTAITTEFPPMTQADVAKLPIRSAAIMRNMNTKGRRVSIKKPLKSSTASTTSRPPTKPDPLERTFKITQADIEQSILQRRANTLFPKSPRHPDPYRQTSLRRTQGFKTAVQGIFRYTRDPTPLTPPPPAAVTPSAPSRSPVRTMPKKLDMTALRLARREKMRTQLLARETPVPKFPKPVKTTAAASIGTFNVVHTDTTSIKTQQSRFRIYEIDTDGEMDTETDLETDTDEKVAVEVRRIRRPDVVEIGKGAVQRTREVGGLGSIMAQV